MKRVRFAGGGGSSRGGDIEDASDDDGVGGVGDNDNRLVTLDEDHEQPPAAAPAAAPQPPLQNRVNYTVHDNVQYYELGFMFILVYAHVTEGKPVSSLFLPHENTTPEYDF